MRSTSWQTFRFATIYMISQPIAFLISPLITTSGYQGWISLLLGGLIGVLFICCTVYIGRLNPGVPWVQFGEQIIGKWPHRFVLLLVLFWCVYYISIDLESFTLFYGATYMRETPQWFLQLIIGLVIVITARWGFVSIVYMADGLFLITMIGTAIILGLFTANANFQMFPALWTHHKMGLAVRDTFTVVSWFGEWFVFLFMVPHLKFGPKTLRNLLSACLLVTFAVSLQWMLTLFNFGPYFGSRIQYPLLELIRSSTLSGFLGNADPLLIGLWTTSMFVHDAFILYVGTKCAAQLFKFQTRKAILPLLGGTAVVVALQYSRDTTRFLSDMNSISIVMFWVLVDALPVYYAVIAYVRIKFGNKLFQTSE
ncbi:GerAB/ArcD/ProY family transporter [Paenibacillus chitinolyticus]|uniref:GerAB/ArcD/ProY family transporter n=1 Tax=Paenibacillus chitinolyticus TaxID=79263 RepID=UPI002DBC7669|nr:GerAB/ArcD/ProY family transporter [Paenibacillus chitinolyticus]MEC0245517.1 GerAB/ArcD/ProY family transporter [Paenibacillus chitinolyticus]